MNEKAIFPAIKSNLVIILIILPVCIYGAYYYLYGIDIAAKKGADNATLQMMGDKSSLDLQQRQRNQRRIYLLSAAIFMDKYLFWKTNTVKENWYTTTVSYEPSLALTQLGEICRRLGKQIEEYDQLSHSLRYRARSEHENGNALLVHSNNYLSKSIENGMEDSYFTDVLMPLSKLHNIINNLSKDERFAEFLNITYYKTFVEMISELPGATSSAQLFMGKNIVAKPTN